MNNLMVIEKQKEKHENLGRADAVAETIAGIYLEYKMYQKLNRAVKQV
jgi:hypothetical protein